MLDTAYATGLATASRPQENTTPDSTLRYRPEIDGLRAFAVIPVILFHLGLDTFHGGSLGVDVFFVISGFLITSIVKREADAGKFSFASFWARRVRRIMPAMLAVTIASLLFTAIFVYHADRPDIYTQAAWSLFSGANIYFWQFVGDYWGRGASESPFLHMWSLAVEEQFYLFFPLSVWLVYRFARRALLPVTLGILITSLALFLYTSQRWQVAAFYLLPTRAWELAAGCALAVVGARSKGIWQATLGVLGLAVIVSSYFLIRAERPGAGMILPVLGTVLVIAFARSGPAFAVLANPLCVYIGKLSYSLYLWHWPVIVFPLYLGRHLPVWQTVGLMTVLSVLSYYFVETPTRHAKRMVPYTLGVLLLTAVLSFGLSAVPLTYYDASAFETPQVYGTAYDSYPDDRPSNLFPNMNVVPRMTSQTAHIDGGLRTGQGNPQVVLLGDSHGTVWAPIVHEMADRLSVPASLWAMNGVDPFFKMPLKLRPVSGYINAQMVLQYDEARVKLLAEWKPKVVIVASRWNQKEMADVKPFFDYITQNSQHVLLIEQPPELEIGNRNALDYLCFKHVYPIDGQTQYYDEGIADLSQQGRQLVRDIAAAYPNVSVIETFDLYHRDGKVRVLDGRKILYRDDDHLNYYGASLAGQRIEDAVTASLKR